jgi:hypothetical protein
MKKYLPLSFSSIKEFAKSPNHFIYYKNKKRKSSPAMLKGSAVHTMVLEPQEFELRYFVIPDGTNRGTKAWKEYASIAADREILKEVEYNVIAKMARMVCEHYDAREILKEATEFEQHIKLEFNGLPFHGFADIVTPNIVCDLKTTRDSTAKAFMRTVLGFKYHWQAALYMKATGKKTFRFITIESSAPYSVVVYELSQDLLDKAVMELIEVTNKFKAWDGLEQGYVEGVQMLEMPSWM